MTTPVSDTDLSDSDTVVCASDNSRERTSIRRNAEKPKLQNLGQVDYAQTWEMQRKIAAERASGDRRDTILLLEHPATYTAGKSTRPEDRPHSGRPVIDVDRGGRITWHGPGQLVGYPIIALSEPINVIEYVRRLEGALITTCTRLGIKVNRVEGRSGVWCSPAEGQRERKIAAIGIRIQRGVTMHGFALNCNCDLAEFSHIVPCGIADAGVTSLSAELGRDVTIDEVRDAAAADVLAALDGRIPVSQNV